MANLVVWASGLMEILADKDTPLDSGPVVLEHGLATKLRSTMVANGQYREYGKVAGWYVPGTKPLPADEDDAALVQRDNMTAVIEFNRKLRGGA